MSTGLLCANFGNMFHKPNPKESAMHQHAGDYPTNWAVDNGTFTIAPNATGTQACDTITTSDYCQTAGYWWPNTWVSNYCGQDKFGQAFRIAQKLMEMKIVKVDNDVAKFVKLVNVIAAEL